MSEKLSIIKYQLKTFFYIFFNCNEYLTNLNNIQWAVPSTHSCFFKSLLTSSHGLLAPLHATAHPEHASIPTVHPEHAQNSENSKNQFQGIRLYVYFQVKQCQQFSLNKIQRAIRKKLDRDLFIDANGLEQIGWNGLMNRLIISRHRMDLIGWINGQIDDIQVQNGLDGMD